MPSIHFDKSTTISDGIHIPQTYNVSKGFDRISQFNEAVAEVDKGMLEKREKQLKEMGFNHTVKMTHLIRKYYYI